MFRYLKFFLFVFLLIINSCYKDQIIIDNTDIIGKTYPPIDVSAQIIGKVHDEFGKNISNYSCKMMNSIYSASNSPYYHFDAIDANKNGTLLTVDCDYGNFEFLVKPIENDINYFSHAIITKPDLIKQSSKKDIDVIIGNNIDLMIKGDSYISNNNPYRGDVVIKTFTADLKDPNHLEAIPGGHLASDVDSNFVWLNYFNVVYLEMESDKQQPLTIAKKNATISFENLNCSDCSVWKYNKKSHLWNYFSNIEDRDKPEFKISKSGFYSIAKPYIFNLVEGSVIIDSEQKPLINQAVDIYFEDRLVERVYTTNKGNWFTHLPLNREFSYKVDIECNGKYEKKFTIDEKDAIISPVAIDANSISSIRINGVVRDCNNEKSRNNFFELKQGSNLQYYFFNIPEIDFEVPYCSNMSINIRSADENWYNIGPDIVYHPSKGIINFNNVYTCNQIEMDGYFTFCIDGSEKLFRITESKFQDGRTELLFYDSENIDAEFSILFSGAEAREYLDNELNIYFKNLNIDGTIYEMNCSSSTVGCGFKNFYIYSYGKNKGDWINGTFNGKFWVKMTNPLRAGYKNVKGEFLVKRYFD